MDKHDPYAALKHAGYRNFLFGRGVFMIGAQMQTAAVGWEIYERLGSVMALGLVGLVQIVPVLLLALPAGHVADQFDRKKIIMAGLALYLVCSTCLGLLSWANGAPQLIYVFLFFIAVARAFTMPSMGSLLPLVIPREVWGNAATWNSSLFELTGMVGPALAGLVIGATKGATTVFVLSACCSALSIVLFSRLRPMQRSVTRRPAALADVLGGLKFVFRTRLMLAASSLDLFAVLLGGTTALLPVVAKEILHAGPEGFGWLRAAPAFGAAGMALITAHLKPWKRSGRVLCLAFLGFGAAIIVFGLSRNYWLSLAMLVLTGVFDNLNVVIRQTLVQYITPDEMRGRVSAVNFIFIGCSNELGAFRAGTMAQMLGTVPAILFGGIGTVLVVLAVMRLSPQLRRLGPLSEVQPAPA